MRGGRMMARGAAMAGVVAAIGALAGCEAMGRGTQEALYKIPKGSRVLVFVDPHLGSDIPLDVPAALGQEIADHMFSHKAGDAFVSQQSLIGLRSDSETFSKMAIQDVARQTGADVVVYVDLLQFAPQETSEGQLTLGSAAAMVKVVDAHGERKWPPGAEAPGMGVQANVQEQFSEQQDLGAVKRKMIHDLALRIGRSFHDWDKDDKAVNR